MSERTGHEPAPPPAIDVTGTTARVNDLLWRATNRKAEETVRRALDEARLLLTTTAEQHPASGVRAYAAAAVSLSLAPDATVAQRVAALRSALDALRGRAIGAEGVPA